MRSPPIFFTRSLNFETREREEGQDETTNIKKTPPTPTAYPSAYANAMSMPMQPNHRMEGGYGQAMTMRQGQGQGMQGGMAQGMTQGMQVRVVHVVLQPNLSLLRK